jgi:Cu/Zn superoxide dismutase
MILASFMNLHIHKRSKITQSFDKKNFKSAHAHFIQKKSHFHEALYLLNV